MRQHSNRCTNLRVVSVEASDLAGNRKGGSIVLDELCEAKQLAQCVGLLECEILTDAQRRELLATPVTRLRERAGGPSLIGDRQKRPEEEVVEIS